MSSESTFDNLPLDIIHYILEYTGKVYYHKGKYINKLDLIKYDAIKKCIKNPIKIENFIYNRYLINKETLTGYILHYIFNDEDLIRVSILFCRDSHFTSSEYFVIPNITNKWRRVISYENF